MSRRVYDMQTRQRLIARVIGGERISDVCKESGVSYSALHSWVIAETKGLSLKGESCPRCGAIPSQQRHKVRHASFESYDRADDMNPVDGFLCPYCNEAFRVSRLESECGFIVDWRTEFEFPPHYCPNCGACLDGKLTTDEAVER